MVIAYVVVTVLVAVANAGAAAVDFLRPRWLLVNMTKAGVPHSWLIPLAALKVAGAFGVLAGIGVPLIGVAASAGLTAYFVGAVRTVLRARLTAHLPSPVVYLLLAVAALVLRLASL